MTGPNCLKPVSKPDPCGRTGILRRKPVLPWPSPLSNSVRIVRAKFVAAEVTRRSVSIFRGIPPPHVVGYR